MKRLGDESNLDVVVLPFAGRGKLVLFFSRPVASGSTAVPCLARFSTSVGRDDCFDKVAAEHRELAGWTFAEHPEPPVTVFIVGAVIRLPRIEVEPRRLVAATGFSLTDVVS